MGQQIIIGALLAALLAGVSLYKKWLDAGGAAAAWVVGLVVWVAGGLQTSLPLLIFFVSGSVFSKMPKKQASVESAKEKRPRDFKQVFCNGGVGTLCLLAYLIWGNSWWLVGYFTSLAVSTADTWASELGVRAGGKVIDIVGFRPLAAGLSGGVSLAGTMAGLLGSSAIGACLLAYPAILHSTGWVVATGFAGMLADSLLGSLLQARYVVNGRQMEEPAGNGALLEKGLRWVTNDWVNLLSNILVTAAVVSGMAFAG